jgi:hypothetical protein
MNPIDAVVQDASNKVDMDIGYGAVVEPAPTEKIDVHAHDGTEDTKGHSNGAHNGATK